MADKVIVYTYAVADLLHIGHLRCLQQARALGDHLIVGVLTDEATAAYKRCPIIPFEERIELVRSLQCVTGAVKQEALDPTETIKRLLVRIDIVTHSHGENERFPGDKIEEFARETSIRLVRTNYCPGISTTDIIERIRRAGDWH